MSAAYWNNSSVVGGGGKRTEDWIVFILKWTPGLLEEKKEQETMGEFTKFGCHFVFNVGLGASHRNKVNLQRS